MSELTLSVRSLAAGYGRREVFRNATFQVPAGQSLGVIGPSGAGKTTLLRTIVGLLKPWDGEVRIRGLAPRDALSRTPVAYFAGDATLPGSVRAVVWGSLGATDLIISERRRIRTLSRGTRQLLGLRTVLSRHPLDLIVLDEPWEALDTDGARWLSSTIETKRDRGAAVLLSSHRLHDLAGLCDAYLCLLPHQVVLMKAHEIAPVGPVTPALLVDLLDKLRSASSLRPLP
jgi:ABC-type multidrug transport system ATPase subunit